MVPLGNIRRPTIGSPYVVSLGAFLRVFVGVFWRDQTLAVGRREMFLFRKGKNRYRIGKRWDACWSSALSLMGRFFFQGRRVTLPTHHHWPGWVHYRSQSDELAGSDPETVADSAQVLAPATLYDQRYQYLSQIEGVVKAPKGRKRKLIDRSVHLTENLCGWLDARRAGVYTRVREGVVHCWTCQSQIETVRNSMMHFILQQEFANTDVPVSILDVLAGEGTSSEKRRTLRAAFYEGGRKAGESLAHQQQVDLVCTTNWRSHTYTPKSWTCSKLVMFVPETRCQQRRHGSGNIDIFNRGYVFFISQPVNMETSTSRLFSTVAWGSTPLKTEMKTEIDFLFLYLDLLGCSSSRCLIFEASNPGTGLESLGLVVAQPMHRELCPLCPIYFDIWMGDIPTTSI